MRRRYLAAAALAVIGFVLGWLSGHGRAAGRSDYSAYDRAQLSWVEEGILERISELEDELARVRELQRE